MHSAETVPGRQEDEELNRLIALSLRAADTAQAHASVSSLRGKLRRGRRGATDQRNKTREQHALSEYASKARDVALSLANAVKAEKVAAQRAASSALQTLDICCNALRGLRCVEEVRGDGVKAVLHGQQQGIGIAYPKLRARLLVLFARAALASFSCDEQSQSMPSSRICLGGPAAAAVALREALCIGEQMKTKRRHAHDRSDCEHAHAHSHAHNHEGIDDRSHTEEPLLEAVLLLRARALQQLSLPLLCHAHATHAAQLVSYHIDADKPGVCAHANANGEAHTLSAEALRAVWQQRQRVRACTFNSCDAQPLTACPGDAFAKAHDLMARARVSASEGLANTAFLLLNQAKQLLVCYAQTAEFPAGHPVHALASRALTECNAAHAACCQRLGRNIT